MEKVIPKSKTKLLQTFSRRFDLKKPSSVVLEVYIYIMWYRTFGTPDAQ